MAPSAYNVASSSSGGTMYAFLSAIHFNSKLGIVESQTSEDRICSCKLAAERIVKRFTGKTEQISVRLANIWQFFKVDSAER
jgi:hypothetical protein